MASSRCAGASVLCYAIDKGGRRHYLLGQDSDGHTWSDFGGGCKRNERSAHCAARELEEETHGVVQHMYGGPLKHIDLTRVCSSVRFRFKDHHNNSRHYTTYALEVTRGELVQRHFQMSRNRVRCARLSPEDRRVRLEKRAVEYTDLTDGFKLRSFFKLRLRHIEPFLDEIARVSPSRAPVRHLVVDLKPP